MRRHAKRSSVGSTQRGATGLGRLAVGLLVAVLGLLALATTSPASTLTRARTLSFGSDGTTASHFGNPGSLAFNQAADKLYVLDRVNLSTTSTPSVLEAFDTPAVTPSGGAFPKTLPPSGFEAPIAVDNTAGASAGHLFYVDDSLGNRQLYGYDASGAPLGGNFPVPLPASGLYTGAAVDSAGNIYVANADTGARNIRKYDSAGNFLTTISTSTLGGPGWIAFDSNNDLFFGIAPLGGGQSGTYKATAASGYAQASFTKIGSRTESSTALAVDTATHTLYVVHSEVGQPTTVEAYSATTGAFLYDFASGIPSAGFRGIAVDQGSDTVYLADDHSFTVNAGTIHAFGPAQSYADATATLTAAKNVTDTTAEIGATIADNNVLPTDWRLEFSDDGGQSWTTVKSGRTANKSATIADTGPSTGTLSLKAAGGTFSLTFGAKTTTGIACNASAATVKSALEALPTIGAGNVSVLNGPGSASGSTPYTITFTGALAGTEVSKITADPTNLVAAPETVSTTASGLDPNTDYKFRVITNKGSSPSTEVASPALGFHTLAPPPVISDVGAIQVQDTSARLVGTIDPRNAATGYVFEYGTTPALGSATAPVNIGGGTKPITVSQVVSGLAKDTTYYFRLLATNLTGATTSPSQTLHTRTIPFPPAGPTNCVNEARRAEQGYAFLPACRAYEMVSPPDKNQGSLTIENLGHPYLAVSRNGDSAAFEATSQFADPPGQLSYFEAFYMSRRGPQGWSTAVPFPRYCPYDPPSDSQNVLQNVFLSEDFDRAIVKQPESASCPFPLLDPAAPLWPGGSITGNLYREDFGAGPAYDLLTPRPREEWLGFFSFAYAGGSEDYSHIIYLGKENQTEPPDSPPEGSFSKLYEWVEEGEDGCATPGGCLRLASVAPDDQPFTTASLLPLPMSRLGNPPNPVSEDGERIYFQNRLVRESCQTAACQLYMREAGTTTFHVSASECTVDCGTDTSAAALAWTSPAGDTAVFTSCDKLTDASAAPSGKPCGVSSNDGGVEVADQAKLYRWDRNAPPGHRLTDISVDHEPADGSQPGALDVIGASDDGETIFFVAGGQIVAGGPIDSVLKLYRWRWNEGAPGVDYLGPYVSRGVITVHVKNEKEYNFLKFITRVTPDGRYLLLQTKLAMVPAADRDTDVDLYRWDESEGWRCVSCQLPGRPSAGDAERFQVPANVEGFNSGLFSTRPSYSLIDDGRVFFTTPDALVAADVNGEAGCEGPGLDSCEDVYEWNDGTVSLVSSGSGDDPAILVGASHDGRDVFFLTRQRLLGWDVDDQVDLYDARSGGGFSEPPPVPPPCEGEGCRGPASGAPDTAGAGTAVFEGPGNKPAGPSGCKRGFVKRHGKCVGKKGRRHHKRAANNQRRTGR